MKGTFFCFRNDVDCLMTKRDQVIDSWKSNRVNLDTVASHISFLQERQTSFEEKEDYDGAAEVNQQIEDLVNQSENFKYEHPVLNEQVFQLIHTTLLLRKI